MKKIHTFVVLAYKCSPYLEDCIRSVLNQKYNSKVIIATTTDNEYIRNLANKYNLDIMVGKHTNIGGDFDFAVSCGNTQLVTVAHQDDVYEYEYSQEIVDRYMNYNDASIIFSDYYEIRENKKVKYNLNLIIKRILLLPLRLECISKFQFFKRLVLRFGNSICCPAVTFVKNNCPNKIFSSNYKCNVDWFAWEKLSKQNGRFIYLRDKLMGHRISVETTTTDIINDGIRTREDFDMFCCFWPKWFVKIINLLYKNSENSNTIRK